MKKQELKKLNKHVMQNFVRKSPSVWGINVNVVFHANQSIDPEKKVGRKIFSHLFKTMGGVILG